MQGGRDAEGKWGENLVEGGIQFYGVELTRVYGADDVKR